MWILFVVTVVNLIEAIAVTDANMQKICVPVLLTKVS